jgi:hypothetical protein
MLVPQIGAEQAARHVSAWFRSLWFAPLALRRDAPNAQRMQGVFLPYWSFDATTRTHWRGERGEDYRTAKKRRTRCQQRVGKLEDTFDDVLIPATRSIPAARLQELEPWDLTQRIDFDPALVAGFRAEHYVIEPVDGLAAAQRRIDEMFERRIRKLIGGDRQRVHEMHTAYSDLSFQHWLLPVWMSSYRQRGKSHAIVVNARTGEVHGERPWSWVKIGAALAAAAALVAVLTSLSTPSV